MGLAFPENLLKRGGKGRVTQLTETINEMEGHIVIATWLRVKP